MFHLKTIFSCLSVGLTLFAFAQTPKNIKKTAAPNTQAANTQNKSYAPDFFLVIDSTLGKWNNHRKKIELKSYEYYESGYKLTAVAIDSPGIPYAIGTINRNEIYGEHVFRFINNEWQVFEQNTSDRMDNLLTDGKGVVYGVSKNKIYRAAGDGWEEIFTGNFKNFNVLAGYDGNIYIKEPVYKKDKYLYSKFSKVNNGKLEVFTDHDKPLDVGHDDLYIDRNGLLYQYDRRQQRVGIWNGREWNYTDSIDIAVTNFWCFDKDNDLYIASKRMFKNLSVVKLDGTNWRQLTVPDSIGTKNNYWKLISDVTGKVYLQFDIDFEEANLYLIKDDRFENMGKQPARKTVSQGIKTFLIAGDKFFALHEDNEYQGDGYYKKITEPIQYSPVWEVKVRKMAQVPNYEIVSKPYMNEYKNLYKCYLFDDNGKYGMQTMDGRIIAEAVFDKIYVDYTPSHMLDLKEGEDLCAIGTFFCYTLIQGKDTLFSKIGSYDFELPDPGTLEMFKCRVSSTCSYCKGSGIIKAHSETITVKGEWVPPVVNSSTSTSYEKRWNGLLGRDVMYVTTKTSNNVVSGGYYKPDTQKTISVPERKCNRCDGRAIKRSYQIYKFDKNNKVYNMIWN